MNVHYILEISSWCGVDDDGYTMMGPREMLNIANFTNAVLGILAGFLHYIGII